MKNKKPVYRAASLIFGILMVFLGLNSCENTGVSADQMQEICFTEEVLPIFQNSCATSGCHDTNGESGYSYTDYNSIMKSITPGDADNSKAYKAITSTYEIMPPGNPLSQNNRTIIRLWIEQGAKETTCGTK
jgi:uncharacterized membrane protein